MRNVLSRRAQCVDEDLPVGRPDEDEDGVGDFRGGEIQDAPVEFIRGSHRWGRWFAPFDSMTDGSRYESEAFERCPDIEAHRADYEIVSWELEPGDCIFFHGLMLHQGRSNPTKATRRRTVTHRWLGDDATFAVREPISEFPKIDTQMSHGQRFKDVADFPLVWQKAA